MRIVLTGATGFVGRHLLPLLAKHEVFAIRRSTPVNTSGGRPMPAGSITWIDADLSRGLDTRQLPASADALIHLAQSDRYRDFPAGAGDVFRVNVEVPATLMRWACEAGVSRAVFASTGTVYEPFRARMDEDAAVRPTGYYGASKLACETLTLPYQSEALSVAQLRLFFIYGPGQGNSMLARVMDNVASGKAVQLPAGSDGLVFAPTYVGDVARALLQATEEAWRGVWNVAGPESASLGQYIEMVASVTGSTPVIQRTASASPQPIVPDLTKLWGRMAAETFVPLEDGIRRTLARV